MSDLDRDLESADVAHRAAVPVWRRALLDVVARADGTSSRADAVAVTGAPGRRDVLRIGGVTIAGALLAAACSGDDETGSADTAPDPAATAPDGGSTPDGTATTDTPASGTSAADGPGLATADTSVEVGVDTDRSLLRTATSLELAAIDAYRGVLDNAEVLALSPPVVAVVRLFQAHHGEHAAALQAATEAAGAAPFDQPNAYLVENVVGPAISALTDEESVLELALLLENAAAQTYVRAGGVLSTPALRQAVMAIGGAEERHAVVLRGVLGDDQVPFSFTPVDQAAPDEATVPAT